MRLKYQNGFIFEGHTFVVDKSDIRNAKNARGSGLCVLRRNDMGTRDEPYTKTRK